MAPVIPGLNDSQIAEILERAKASGAAFAFKVMLRFPAEVKDVFLERLNAAYPDRYKKVVNAVMEMRGGKMYDSRFGARTRGTGERWQAIEWLFDLTCKRLGMNIREELKYPNPPATFERPPLPLVKGDQMELF